MAIIRAFGGGGLPDQVTLSAAQSAGAVSTNVVDRGGGLEAALLDIVAAVGATPTVTVDVQGSADGTNWWNVPYETAGTPGVRSAASLTITAAGTTRLWLPPDYPWRYLRLAYSANTNVTLTVNVWIF